MTGTPASETTPKQRHRWSQFAAGGWAERVCARCGEALEHPRDTVDGAWRDAGPCEPSPAARRFNSQLLGVSEADV